MGVLDCAEVDGGQTLHLPFHRGRARVDHHVVEGGGAAVVHREGQIIHAAEGNDASVADVPGAGVGGIANVVFDVVHVAGDARSDCADRCQRNIGKCGLFE